MTGSRTVVLEPTIPAAATDLAEILRESTGDVIVTAPGVVLPGPAAHDLASRPGTVTAVAAAAPVPVRTGFGRVLAVGTDRTPLADASVGAVGWLRISASDRSAAAAALGHAAPQLAAVGGDESFAWVLRTLVRAGVVVRADAIAPYPYSVTGGDVSLDPVATARIRLVRANRSGDSGYSVAVLRRLSKPLTALAARRGWSPNAITLLSLLIGLTAAGAFAVGSRWALVAGAVLLQVSLVVDCSDGEVARLTGRYSRTGAWLDAVTDRVKEFAAYAGLAAGAAWVSGADLWWVAAALMVLQTVRHVGDYTFEVVQREWATADVRGPLLGGVDVSPPSGGGAAPASMLRRALFLPIGERWLILSLAAAFFGAAAALWVLLGLGVVSLLYATAGRAVRTRRWTGGPVATGLIVRQLDTAPFGLRLPLGARSGALLLAAAVVVTVAVALLLVIVVTPAAVLLLLGSVLLLGVRAAIFRPAWAAPAALAALEAVPWLVAGLSLAPACGPVFFGLLFTLSFHRYDLLYRALGGEAMPRWLLALSGGAPVRLAVLGVTLLVAPAALSGVAAVLAVYLVLVTVVLASAQWLPAARRSEEGAL